jgi:hypothetical protein
MTTLKIQDHQIINGMLPEIPDGVTELNCYGCRNLETITNIPATVKKLNLERCGKLKTLPQLPEGLEELYCSGCNDLETITNIPATVKRLYLGGCGKLKILPQLPEGLEDLNCYDCSGLETITNIPVTVKKLNLEGCVKLKTLPQLPEGLEDLNCFGCSDLETITNIPTTVKTLYLGGCKKLKTLPQLLEGLEELNCYGCETLETITNIPTTLKKLELFDCRNLIKTPELEARLAELELAGCVITYPSHFVTDKAAEAKEKLNKVITTYVANNPEGPGAASFQPIKDILHRYLSEGLGQRGGDKAVILEVNPVLNFLEKDSRILPIINEVSNQLFAGCVNQPVRGWSEICALVAIAGKEKITDKIEAARQLKTIDVIASFIGELPSDKKPGEQVEVEAGNALLREVHKELLKEQILEQPWLGVPKLIAYEGFVTTWLTRNIIEDVVNKVKGQVFAKSQEEIAEYLCETHHQEAWGEICFPDEIKEIKKEFESRSDHDALQERSERIAKTIRELTEKSLKEESLAGITSTSAISALEGEIPKSNPSPHSQASLEDNQNSVLR